jgi:hypothetical protein
VTAAGNRPSYSRQIAWQRDKWNHSQSDHHQFVFSCTRETCSGGIFEVGSVKVVWFGAINLKRIEIFAPQLAVQQSVCFHNNVQRHLPLPMLLLFVFQRHIPQRGEKCLMRKGCQMSRTVQDVEEDERKITDERRASLKVCRNNTVASRGRSVEDPGRGGGLTMGCCSRRREMQYMWIERRTRRRSLLPWFQQKDQLDDYRPL